MSFERSSGAGSSVGDAISSLKRQIREVDRDVASIRNAGRQSLETGRNSENRAQNNLGGGSTDAGDRSPGKKSLASLGCTSTSTRRREGNYVPKERGWPMPKPKHASTRLQSVKAEGDKER